MLSSYASGCRVMSASPQQPCLQCADVVDTLEILFFTFLFTYLVDVVLWDISIYLFLLFVIYVVSPLTAIFCIFIPIQECPIHQHSPFNQSVASTSATQSTGSAPKSLQKTWCQLKSAAEIMKPKKVRCHYLSSTDCLALVGNAGVFLPVLYVIKR